MRKPLLATALIKMGCCLDVQGPGSFCRILLNILEQHLTAIIYVYRRLITFYACISEFCGKKTYTGATPDGYYISVAQSGMNLMPHYAKCKNYKIGLPE